MSSEEVSLLSANHADQVQLLPFAQVAEQLPPYRRRRILENIHDHGTSQRLAPLYFVGTRRAHLLIYCGTFISGR